jgi:uncharacterized membrane protein
MTLDPNAPTPVPTSSMGLAPNVAGALAYLLGPITGILFLVLEKENRFVRFHAAQSTAFSVVWIIAWVVFGVVISVIAVIPILGWLIGAIAVLVNLVVALGGLIFWLFLMLQAFGGREYEIPWIGAKARTMILGESDLSH